MSRKFQEQKKFLLSSDIESRLSQAAQDALKKCVITEDFEMKPVVPGMYESTKLKKKRAKREKPNTLKDWYDLPAPELTPEKKNDLEILRMRSALDSKHFYKKNDLKVLPKYFQVGKVIESSADFYHSRIPQKQRKRTLVDELLADAEFKKKCKKKYKSIVYDQSIKSKRAHRYFKNVKREEQARDKKKKKRDNFE